MWLHEVFAGLAVSTTTHFFCLNERLTFKTFYFVSGGGLKSCRGRSSLPPTWTVATHLQHAEKLLHIRPLRLQQLVHHVAETRRVSSASAMATGGRESSERKKVPTAEAQPGFPLPLRGTRAWCRRCAGVTQAEQAVNICVTFHVFVHQ